MISKKLKGIVLSGALVTSVLGLSPSANAETLGWSEDGIHITSNEQAVVNYAAASEPESHRGWTEAYDEYTERAVGQTEWKDKYHYTRARMVSSWTGEVQTDSGRVWGHDSTIARSPYSVNEHTARTYWGS
ncbi:hypothetical protein ACFSCX_13265 [Bacillus salitolerans]|uniref:Lactococcin 972 family bacteriocin n=1 Tax=Bacillus salitolerans TaxID=1437434 RepID=A0ABW4LR49_9BACI